MMRPIIFFLVTFLAIGQEPPAQPDLVIRINVNLVQMDAVVTDSKGQPVTGLTRDDFEILQDGKSQPITNFSYISVHPPTTPTAAKPAAPKGQPSAPQGQKAAPPPPPTRLRPDQIRRTVAMVVDDLGLSFESITRVRDSIRKFVNQEMQPGDLVAVIRTGAGMGALQQFTGDQRQLNAAVDRIKFNGFGRVGVSSFTPLGSDEDPASMRQEREEIFSVGTLGAVRYVVEGLRELPGRKSVVLFSENLRLWQADGMNQRVLDNVRHLEDEANRSSVVIYSIDPRGLQYHGITAADNTNGMTPAQIARIPMQRSEEVFRSQDGLVMLAHDTGGLFLHDTNDIDGAVRKVMADSEGYYLLAYHPAADTFDPRTGQPKFHKVVVRVKRPGLHVRHRTGFFGTSDRGRPPVAHTRQAELAHALTSPFATGAIPVQLTTMFTNAPKAGSYITTLLHIDAKALKFEDEPDDWHKAILDVLAVTFGDNGQAVDFSDKTFTIRMHAEVYKFTLEHGLIYSMHHPVKKPGAYQMRIALRDAGNEQVGSASQFLEVPDVNKGRLTLSSLVLQEQPPEAPKQQPQPQEAAPSNTIEQEGQVADQNPEGGPAVRIFRPGHNVIYGYQVLNAQGDTAQHPELEVQTRLYRPGEDKPVYEGTPHPLPLNNQPDPKRLVAGGSLKLGDKIAPGEYVLQVIVTDKLAKEKFRTTTQWMDFEIR